MNNTIYKLQNKNGVEIAFLAYGCKVISIKTPDRDGNIKDIVLGYPDLDGYLKGDLYFGAMCGRNSNRIDKGVFTLEGKTYQLETNNPPNNLHGGTEGFHCKYWDVEPITIPGRAAAYKLSYFAKDGESGYPGNLTVTVIYSLTEDNEFVIDMHATTDKATLVNMVNHSYFNLHGEGEGNILDHKLMINANEMTPLGSNMVPTGEILKVANSALDFTKPKYVQSALDEGHEQISLVNCIDHNWVINKPLNELGLHARLTEEKSGRGIEVYSTQPGIQIYIGVHLDGSDKGKGKAYEKYGGIAMETQHFPDAINHDNFPSVVLKPGDEYKHTCVYKFIVE